MVGESGKGRTMMSGRQMAGRWWMVDGNRKEQHAGMAYLKLGITG